jgi:hypothetical protein
MRFGKRSVRSLYKASSFMTVAKGNIKIYEMGRACGTNESEEECI